MTRIGIGVSPVLVRVETAPEPEPGPPITARSVVFDIANNWGDSTVAVRSIEFLNAGSVIPLEAEDFTAYSANQLNVAHLPQFAFITSLSKTGSGGASTSFNSSSPNATNQRLIVVFNSAKDFNEIVVNNYHFFGSLLGRGARNVKITATESVYTDTTYDAAVTGGTVLNTSEWPQHVAADTADDQTVWIAPPA